MRALWRVLGVALFYTAWIKRQWMWIVQSIMSTVGIVMLAYGWGGHDIVKTAIPVYIIITTWSFGANLVAQMVGYDRVSREWERMVASQLTLFEYFTGIVLGALPFVLPSIALLVPIATAWGFGLKLITIALLLSPLSMALGTFLSLSIVLRIRNPMNISAVTNPLVTATTFLPPVLYPPTVLPEPLRSISIAVPPVALAEITKALSIGVSTTPIHISIASVIAWLVTTGIATLRVLKWGLE
jgi:ABC-2 type transporter.|uniref:ABC transporter permease n=1 Tax=Ignisphaera aggregans TaxID=334771 RepID=A0A7J3Z7Q7_9CREN